ncbi:MAG: FAD-dependent oxidoreductase [Rhodoferax sp.]|nr:FAD-dependent oxidoreductase [Rhodoferax sp.]
MTPSFTVLAAASAPVADIPFPFPSTELLDAQWAGQANWTVLDTGLAEGQRFLSIWQQWRSHPAAPAMLHGVGVLSAEQASCLQRALPAHATNPAQLELAQTLAAQCIGLDAGFHRILLEQGRLCLTLCVGDLQQVLQQQAMQVDWVLAPASAAGWDMWLLKALARHCQRGTLLFAANALPDARLLQDAGFMLAAKDGQNAFTARFNPPWELRRTRTRSSNGKGRVPGQCAVIGAGLAGASVAHALALRGWQVQVLDAQPQAAGGASGVPVGLLLPLHTADDSPAAQLSRNGTRLTLQHAQRLLQAGQDWCQTGVLECLLGGEVPGDGAMHGTFGGHCGDKAALWHPHAAWIKPAQLVAAWLAHERIRFTGQCAVQSLERAHRQVQEQVEGQWLLRNAADQLVAQADCVVFANALGCVPVLNRLMGSLPGDSVPWMPGLQPALATMQGVHGTLSWGRCRELNTDADKDKDAYAGTDIAGTSLANRVLFPPYPVTGHGRLIAPVPGADGPCWYAGATFETDAVPHADTARAHAANFNKLQQLLPEVARHLRQPFAEGKVHAWQGTRCVTSTRMPLVGPLEDSPLPSLWICAGMGARGLAFSALCAELLAAELHGEPLPVERSKAKLLGTGGMGKTGRTGV